MIHPLDTQLFHLSAFPEYPASVCDLPKAGCCQLGRGQQKIFNVINAFKHLKRPHLENNELSFICQIYLGMKICSLFTETQDFHLINGIAVL